MAATTPERSRVARWLRDRRNLATIGWRRTDALARGVVGGLGLVVAGALLHRVDLLLLGAPLLVGTALALRRPGSPSVRVLPRPRIVEQGGDGRVVVSVDPGENTELVALRLPNPAPAAAESDADGAGVGPVHLLPARPLRTRDIGTTVRFHSWGEGVDLRPDHLFAGADGMAAFGPVVGTESRRVVLPGVDPLPPGPLPPRAAGLVGAHRSPRPGDATELRDIRPFRPGDRLRRVDWRVTLRTAATRRAPGGAIPPDAIHVRERHAEADAELVLALDTRTDVGTELGSWSRYATETGVRAGGSLDAGVRAAASFAAAYLRQGDRVGLVDLANPQLRVPPGTGRRQLNRIRHQLVAFVRLSGGHARPVLPQGQVPHGAMLIVLSTFTDDAVVEVAAHAVRRGNLVLAVDLLPDPLVADPESVWGAEVREILLAEHRVRLATLAEHGITVVRWADAAAVPQLVRRARRGASRRGRTGGVPR